MSTMTMTSNRLDPSISGLELKSKDPPSKSDLRRSPSTYTPTPDSNTDETPTPENDDIRNDLPPPSNAVEVLPRWNRPRSNMWRVFATFYAFFLFGLNDGAYGVIISHVLFEDAAMLMSLLGYGSLCMAWFFPLLPSTCLFHTLTTVVPLA